MKFRRVFDFAKDSQKGVTLVELLIAIAITGIIGGAIATFAFQIYDGNTRSTNHMTVIKQLENAIHWLSRDIQMSQTVQPDASLGFPLYLTWTEWNNTVHNVTYSLVGSELQRSASIDSGQPAITIVAQYVDTDSAMTNCQFDNGVFTFKLTAVIDTSSRQISETRVGEIVPRPK